MTRALNSANRGAPTKNSDMATSQLFRALPIALLALSVGGCGAGAVDGHDAGDPIDTTVERIAGPATFFSSCSQAQSNGGAQTERFLDCAPDQILSGVGARVVNDNFPDLTIYCGASTRTERWLQNHGSG